MVKYLYQDSLSVRNIDQLKAISNPPRTLLNLLAVKPRLNELFLEQPFRATLHIQDYETGLLDRFDV